MGDRSCPNCQVIDAARLDKRNRDISGFRTEGSSLSSNRLIGFDDGSELEISIRVKELKTRFEAPGFVHYHRFSLSGETGVRFAVFEVDFDFLMRTESAEITVECREISADVGRTVRGYVRRLDAGLITSYG
ncbi:hypothetical protein J2744_001632 [Halorubrum trapanicum]|uniref:Uncharacterized protein n=1 Tax=Halorubrum trapanicum TaxID=29284 RepID=A0A8J7R807_9EURY|nr:hypothetical protein [Halorubrum trapanicum]MBP1901949.1 hypothetical protein [Halorubrum trapanicum]